MTQFRRQLETRFNDSRMVRMIAGLLLTAIALAALTVAVGNSLTREIDLYVILDASRNLLAGTDIYAVAAPNGAYYLYLPLLAFLFIPLTFIPQTIAGVGWTFICIGLLIWCLRETVRLIAGDEYQRLSSFENWGLHLVPVLFCADAISSEVGNAQVNCLILAAAVLGLKLARTQRDAAAGAILGIAAVAKIFTLPVLFFEALNKRFHLLIGGAVGMAAGLVLPAALVGWRQNIDYVGYWIANIALSGDVVSHRSGFAGNASMQAVLTRLLTDAPAFVWNGIPYHLNIADLSTSSLTTIGLLVPILSLLALVVYFVAFRRRRRLISYWGAVAIAFCIAPLISPVVERPHFVMLLPAYVYVTWLWIHDRIEGKLFYLLLGAAFLLSTFALKLYVGDFWGNVLWSLGAPTIADLCLIGAIIVAAAGQKDLELTAEQ